MRDRGTEGLGSCPKASRECGALIQTLGDLGFRLPHPLKSIVNNPPWAVRRYSWDSSQEADGRQKSLSRRGMPLRDLNANSRVGVGTGRRQGRGLMYFIAVFYDFSTVCVCGCLKEYF